VSRVAAAAAAEIGGARCNKRSKPTEQLASGPTSNYSNLHGQRYIIDHPSDRVHAHTELVAVLTTWRARPTPCRTAPVPVGSYRP
jgi:hypothetical protein